MKKSMMFGLMCAATVVCGVAKGETVAISLEVGCDTLAYSVNGGLAIEVDLTGEAYADATALEFDLGHNGAYVVELKKSGSTVKTYNWNVTDESSEVAAESEENAAMLDTRGERSIDCRGGAVLETFTYSGIGWGEQGAGTSATVTFKKDGGNEQTLLGATEGAGEVQWTVERGGKYVFTHKSGDAEETATFVVNGPFTVRVPKSIEHLTCAVYFGETPVGGNEDGQCVRYDIPGSGCTIVFTPTDGYLIESGGVLALPVGDKTLEDNDLPALIAPGEEDNPWKVGAGGTDAVLAYVKNGVLVIVGSGAMSDFAGAADVPWDPATVTTVTVGEGVTQIGANAWSGMGDSVAVNGTALSAVRYLAPGVGFSQPSGAITGAEFETVQIIDGKAYLGVSVATNSEVKVEGEGEDGGWEKAKIEGAKVEDDGTVTLTVPATAEKGFMIIKSKGR